MKFYLKINNTYFFIFHKELFKSPSKHQMDVFIKELSYNTKISRLLMNLNLKNKSQILDVGGNIGYYSILFSKIFSKLNLKFTLLSLIQKILIIFISIQEII